MKAYVIHMPHRKDRYENLIKEFSEQGIIDYLILDAIVHPTVTLVGIAESHKYIVQCAKLNKLPEVLIMEDDVCFYDKGAFDYFIENKPKDYDIYLSSIYHGYIKPDNTVDDFCGLHCYIVNERFYDTFLNAPITMGAGFMNFDRALMNKGKYVVCDPFVCYQMDGFSDNKKENATYGHYMEGRKIFKQLKQI